MQLYNRIFISSIIQRAPITRGSLEARTGFEPVMTVLQTGALPLGYRAILYCMQSILINDSDGNRTRVTAVKGRCLNRLTTEPYLFPSTLHGKNSSAALLRKDLVPIRHDLFMPYRFFISAPRVGLEPTTTRLTAECSTIELSRIISRKHSSCLQNRISNLTVSFLVKPSTD